MEEKEVLEKKVENEYEFEIIMDGKIKCFDTKEEVGRWIVENWSERTTYCLTRKRVKNLSQNGCMQMSVNRVGEKEKI